MKLLADLAADWPALSALLDEALALPSAERAAWLHALPQRPGVTEPLRDTLQRLLAASAAVETGDFLQSLAPAAAAAVGPAEGGLAEGGIVGPWRLVRLLGEGGMGQVFLAERMASALKRPVALKLPRLGWASDLAERMARERDILAPLVHPHIARLYDAGVDASGRPWLALEYVEGRPLDEHCKERSLALRERLNLVLQACDAVAYAHGRLVIHRDLKPANLLVSDDGQLRLLDFGIAKLLADDELAEEATALTRQHGRQMTLAYASPEQVRGERLGTASDQYSLAVVAYELLAGERPYRLQHRTRAEMERAVLEAELPAASRIAADPEAARQLRGDLDAILAKALSKEVDRRYPSVAAFADDLRRHLGGEPVLARPASRGYRLGKWISRHRVPVLAGVAVALSLVLGTAVALRQAAIARGAEALAQAQRESAEASRREAQAREREAREAQALAVAERERARQAEGAALASASEAERERQRAQRAASAERKAAAAERNAAEEARRQTELSVKEAVRANLVGNFMLNSFGRMAGDPELRQQGARERIGAALELELQRLEAETTASPAGVAEANGAAASAFNYLQQAPRQLAASRRALQLLVQAGEQPLRIAEAHRQLALALSQSQQHEAAIAQARAGIAVAPQGPSVGERVLRARLHRAVGRYARNLGRVGEAYEASLASTKAFDGMDPATLGARVQHFGSALAEHAANAGAMERYEEAMATLARVDKVYAVAGPGIGHEADRADIELARCRVMMDIERHDAAADACARALVLYAPQFGAVSYNADIVDSIHAMALMRGGRLDEAGAILQRIRDSSHGVQVWLQSAEWALARGDLKQAEAWLEHQATLVSHATPLRRLSGHRLRAALRMAQGRADEAATEARAALAVIHDNALGCRREERLARLDLAEAEHAAGRDATAVWREACANADRPPRGSLAERRCEALAPRLAMQR